MYHCLHHFSCKLELNLRAFQTITYKIVEPPPDFQFFCLCFPPSPLINVAVPQKVAESRVASRSPTFFKATLTRGEGGMKKSFFSRWLNNFVSDCRPVKRMTKQQEMFRVLYPIICRTQTVYCVSKVMPKFKKIQDRGEKWEK